jgi:hypothetical protein
VTATNAALYLVPVAGFNRLRCPITVYNSGNVSVYARGSSAPVPSVADIDVDITGADTINVTDRIDRLLGRATNYDVLANGTIAALNGTVELVCAGLSTVGLGISGGGWAGTLVAEVDVGDGVWDAIPLIENTLGGAALSTTANGNWLLGVSGVLTLRIRASLWAAGIATVYLNGSSAAAGMFLSRSIPTGLNSIGTVGLDAGANHVGQVGSPGITVPLTPVITGGLYAANDAVGGLLTFANAARVAGLGGVIKDMIIIDDAGQNAELELWLFNQTFTAMADNAAWAPSEADLENCIGVISTLDGTWRAAGAHSVCDVEVAKRYDLVGTSIFGQLVVRGTPTFAAVDDVTVKLRMLQD